MTEELFPDLEPPADAPASTRRASSGASGDAASVWHDAADSSALDDALRPLADRMRPRSFGDFLGQEHLVGDAAPLRRLVAGGRVPSMVLWGPPGSGKTTLAMILAREVDAAFAPMSAVTAGLKEVRTAVEEARLRRRKRRRTILFLDEIHRFNKAQQDALLPHVESGLLTLIGATTENPSFSVNAPLLSRCRVFTLKPLGPEHLVSLLEKGLALLNRDSPGSPVRAERDVLEAISNTSDGDARRALGLLEATADTARQAAAATGTEVHIDLEVVQAILQRHLIYDRAGEEHFNVISALHKTIRSSDPHGAIYWCERMLVAGEDPRYILRRLIRVATEDVGLADPDAVCRAVAALHAFEATGSPEGDLFVTQLAADLAVAPKSNAIYMASKEARALIDDTGTLPVPLHLRNAPTKLMKAEGYGEGYTYDHDAAEHFAPKQGLPDELEGRRIYSPGKQGREAEIAEKLAKWDAARDEAARTHRSSGT